MKLFSIVLILGFLAGCGRSGSLTMDKKMDSSSNSSSSNNYKRQMADEIQPHNSK